MIVIVIMQNLLCAQIQEIESETRAVARDGGQLRNYTRRVTSLETFLKAS